MKEELYKRYSVVDEPDLTLTMKVWEKTLASQIIPMEDVPKTIEKILTNYCKRNIKVKGDGLTKNLKMTIN